MYDSSHAGDEPGDEPPRRSVAAPVATDSTVSRRDVLRTVGATALTTGLGSTASAQSDEEQTAEPTTDPPEREYRTCPHFRILASRLPEDVQAEIETAVTDGAYESSTRPLLDQVMDVDRSYVRYEDAYYDPTIETVEGGYALTLEETETLTFDEPRTLSLKNSDDAPHTVDVAIEDPDGEVLLDEQVDVAGGETVELLQTDVFGGYRVVAGTDDGEEREFVWSVDQYARSADLAVEPDGEVELHQPVVDPVQCNYEIEADPTVRVEVDDAYVAPGDSTTGRVVLSRAPTGLSEFRVGVSVDGDRIVPLEVDLAEQFEELELRYVSDPYPVAVRGADPENQVGVEETDVTLATFSLDVPTDVPVSDEHSPEYAVEVHVDRLLDADSYAVGAGTEDDAFRVPSGDPPRIDGCPDVTGDGTIGHTDVVEFFENMHRSEWKDPDAFDFTGNGEVGHGDVVWLWECVVLS